MPDLHGFVEEYDRQSDVTRFVRGEDRVEIRPRSTVWWGRRETAYDVVANWGDTFQAGSAYLTALAEAFRMMRSR